MTFRSWLGLKVKRERRFIGLARPYHCAGRIGGGSGGCCYCTSKVVTRPRRLDLVLHDGAPAIVFATVDRPLDVRFMARLGPANSLGFG